VLSALESPKDGEPYGWIAREKNIVWIVNGLRHEPSLSWQNGKHRTFLRDRVLAPLGSRLRIVAAFRRHYPEWFPDADSGPNGSHSDASRKGIERVSKQSPVQSNPILSIPSQSSPSTAGGALPATGDIAGTVIGDTVSASVVLTAAANRGIAERWGEQTNPIRHNAGSSLDTAERIVHLSIPVDFARDAIYTWCLTAPNERPPRALGYFLGVVTDRWAAEGERRAAGAITPSVLPTARVAATDVDAELDAWARATEAREARERQEAAHG
jgi:hypothetical protein